MPEADQSRSGVERVESEAEFFRSRTRGRAQVEFVKPVDPVPVQLEADQAGTGVGDTPDAAVDDAEKNVPRSTACRSRHARRRSRRATAPLLQLRTRRTRTRRAPVPAWRRRSARNWTSSDRESPIVEKSTRAAWHSICTRPISTSRSSTIHALDKKPTADLRRTEMRIRTGHPEIGGIRKNLFRGHLEGGPARDRPDPIRCRSDQKGRKEHAPPRCGTRRRRRTASIVQNASKRGEFGDCIGESPARRKEPRVGNAPERRPQSDPGMAPRE